MSSGALSEHWVCPKCAMNNSILSANCVECHTHKPDHNLQESVPQGEVVRPSVPPRPRSLVRPSVPPRPNPPARPSMPPRPPSSVKPSMPPRPNPPVRPSMPPRPNPSVRRSVPPRSNPSVRPSMPPCPHSSVKPSMPPRPNPSVRHSVPPRPNPSVSHSVPPRPNPSVRHSVPPRPNPSVRHSVPPRPNQSVRHSVPPRPNPSVSHSVPPCPNTSVRPSMPPRPQSSERPSMSPRRHSLAKPPEWKCPTCAVVNEGCRKQCRTCGFLRVTRKPSKSSSSEREGGEKRRSNVAREENFGIVSVLDSMLGVFELATTYPCVQTTTTVYHNTPTAQSTTTVYHSTPTAQGSVQVPPEKHEAAHQQQRNDDGGRRQWPQQHSDDGGRMQWPQQHSDEGRRMQWPQQHSDEEARMQGLGDSIELNHANCLNETEANTMYLEIQQYCMEHGEPFTDLDFPPTNKSLYIDPKKTISQWKVYRWERPLQVRGPFEHGAREWTVVREPRPGNVAQGILNNCWFLSALGVVAQQPQLIKDIIITKTFSPRIGAYQVRLCKDGHWQVLVVDDCLPCLTTGELVFSKALRKQLWVPLVEKAMAKLYGSYEALEYGMLLLGLSVLTGLPCEMIRLDELSPENGDLDLMWARLLSFRECNFLMNALCTNKGHPGKGLKTEHAYSILDVRQLGSERLMKLRDPWGRHSWKGSWSDQDPRWHTQPGLRDELQAVRNEPGVFWMGAHDFLKYFSEVNVCRYHPNWYSVRSEGKFHPFAASKIRTLAFQVHSTTEVDISIHQPTSRCRDPGQADMAMLVLRYPSTYQLGRDSPPSLPIACTLESSSQIMPVVATTGFLAPGRYVILPLSFNHYQHLPGTDRKREKEMEKTSGQQERGDGAIPYVVTVFSAQELAHDSLMTGPGFLPESLFLLAEKIGKASKIHPNMVFYEVCLGKLCHIMVAVNSDHRLHFTATVTVIQSVNTVSSRGTLRTTDCIPPRHRQVLIVLTPENGGLSFHQCAFNWSYRELNSWGQRGAVHTPELTSTNKELHLPRLIT